MLKAIILFTALLLSFSSTAHALTATITWDPVTTYADGAAIETGKVVKYEVFRALQSNLSDALKVNTAELTSTSLVDSSLTPNKTYFYFVRAYLILDNPGPNSDIASFRTFPPGKVGKVTIVVTN